MIKITPNSGPSFNLGNWVVYPGLAACVCALAWSLWADSRRTEPAIPQRPQAIVPASFDASSPATPAGRLVEIQKIVPGMRVQAFNPEVADHERASWREQDYAGWSAIDMLLFDRDGNPIYLQLLRSPEWIRQHGAQVSRTIWIELPELNSQGFGKVTFVGPAPKIQPGPGRVVTGTFSHKVANVIDLHVQGLSAPIGVTANHPVWSEDAKNFVAAGNLHPGERIRAAVQDSSTYSIAKVAGVSHRGNPTGEVVYNLEVEGEHAYQVSQLGIVVHNSDPDTYNTFPSLSRSSSDYRGRIMSALQTAELNLRNNPWQAHHVINANMNSSSSSMRTVAARLLFDNFNNPVNLPTDFLRALAAARSVQQVSHVGVGVTGAFDEIFQLKLGELYHWIAKESPDGMIVQNSRHLQLDQILSIEQTLQNDIDSVGVIGTKPLTKYPD